MSLKDIAYKLNIPTLFARQMLLKLLSKVLQIK